jgi:glycosyltransferase involved in cell wall biosynthesis
MTGPDPAASRRAYESLTFVADEPWFASVMETARMEATLERILAVRPDLVLLEGTPLARFLPLLPPDVPRVLDLFDVHSVMAQRALALAGDADRVAAAREAERTLAFEKRAVEGCDACLAVSEADANAARSILGAVNVHVVPNGVDIRYFAPTNSETEPGAMLFTGRMSYEPNADAACHFAADVLPLICREVPHARFHIVGAAPPARVSVLASDRVAVHGRVDDVRPHLAACQVVVVPIRAGGGTRLKVLEAAASGKAIVSTTLGVEGLPFVAEEDLSVADTPSDFAAATIALLRDPERRAALGARAHAVARRYDWSTIGESFSRILEQAATAQRSS